MTGEVNRHNIHNLIKQSKKKKKNFINASTCTKYIKDNYKVKHIDYGSVQIIKIYFEEQAPLV